MIRRVKKISRRRQPALEGSDTLEARIVGLAESRKLAPAGGNAIRAQRKKGLAVTFQRGDEVIKQFPDGHEQILAKIKAPHYEIPVGVRVLTHKNKPHKK